MSLQFVLWCAGGSSINYVVRDDNGQSIEEEEKEEKEKEEKESKSILPSDP